MLKCGCC